MKRHDVLHRPPVWLKLLASGLALAVNAIQFAEVSDRWGRPRRGLHHLWFTRAGLVAFEARQILKHLKLVDDD